VEQFVQNTVDHGLQILHIPLPPAPSPIDPNLQAQIEQAKAEQERLQAAYNQLKLQLDEPATIDSETDLDDQKLISIKMLYKFSQKVVPDDLPGRNIDLFGITSAGKSSAVNALLGSKLAGTNMTFSVKMMIYHISLKNTLH
jgi:hypothetical protein